MAINTITITKSMAGAFFTIIAMATLASAATGLVQPPISDEYLVNQCMAKVSSRCAMYVTAEMYNHGPSLKQNGCCLEVYHMGRICLHIVTKHVMETLVPDLEGVKKQDSLEKSTQLWYFCVPV
ncbi:hypothetical protein CARUB_v10015845mg [Capsella rubella]|uniref:Prolamin-like domain-containing protein n=1 Tax=Capsella rubella TaxID=81985 RepID=R0I3P9_9BRAS|nr:uncharacterized protein LOC17892611 [Capsella rubella]EOA32555.1 hypothetical protein CARUB_v10015845mg [Capsella rubella]